MIGVDADAALKAYSAQNDDEVKRVAQDLASNQFVAFETWK
jgi:hypothetical protein